MEQNVKNRQAEQLWQKFRTIAEEILKSNFSNELPSNFQLPNTEIPSSVTNLLFEDFTKRVKENGYDTIINGIISSFSFDRILKQGLSGTTKNQTLNMFACYLGFKDFEAFAEKNPLPVPKIERGKAKKFDYKLFSWVLIGVIIIMSVVFYIVHKESTINKGHLLPDEKENQVFEFVRAALEEEYQTYKKLPQIDTVGLKKYYSDSCYSYWPGIIRVTNVHHNLNLVLTNPGNAATYTVDTIFVSKVQGDTLFISTKEFWLLPWYNNTQKQYDSTRKIMTDFANTYTILDKGMNMRIIDYKTQVLKRRK